MASPNKCLGELAEYKIVEPTTKEERREAHLAAQALKESRPQESTTPSPQVQVPVQDAKTPTPSSKWIMLRLARL